MKTRKLDEHMKLWLDVNNTSFSAIQEKFLVGLSADALRPAVVATHILDRTLSDQNMSKNETVRALKAIIAYSLNASRTINDQRRDLIIKASAGQFKGTIPDAEDKNGSGPLLGPSFFAKVTDSMIMFSFALEL